MNLEPIMLSVADALGVDHLEPDESGRYSVRFDDKFDVLVRPLERSLVLFEASFGRAPSAEPGAGDYLERVLTRSLLHCRDGAREVMSLDPETKELRLYRLEVTNGLTPSRFHSVLEEFANAVEAWVDYLADAPTPAGLPIPMHLLTP